MARSTLLVSTAFVLAAAACASRARHPELSRAEGCAIASQVTTPLVVEWPSAQRGELEALRAKHVVAVRYTGCDLEILPRCAPRGRYAYVPLTAKHERVRLRDESELYANLPLSAISLSGKLRSSGELDIDMNVVGRFDAEGDIGHDVLGSECSGATHFVAGITTGAFTFVAGAADETGADAKVAGFGAGGSSKSSYEILNKDGDSAACASAKADDKVPPFGCGALLRVELVPIGAPNQLAMPACPAPLMWTGTQCAAPVTPNAPSATVAVAGLVRIPGGTFRFAGDRVVNVASFDMDLTEVTVGDFRRCVKAGRCIPPSGAPGACNYAHDDRQRHPINCVGWEDAKSFCAFEGKRLPTSIEWEFAAIGQSGYDYPWGNEQPSRERVCKAEESNVDTCTVARHPAGKSQFGVLDMTGNVDEWVLDAACGVNRRCESGLRIVRSGSPARTATGWSIGPGESLSPTRGFRCARSVDAHDTPRAVRPGTLFGEGLCWPPEGQSCPDGMHLSRTQGCISDS